MNILVTGAKGQLGSELKLLTDATKDLHFDFHDIDSLDVLDVKSLQGYFSATRPGLVINCAAYTAVDKAENDAENAMLGNCTLVKNLVDCCREYGSALIHISTDYVFDGKNHLPYTENDATNPQGVYGRTKLLGEEAALAYNKSLVIRTSWLYSSFGNNFVKTILRLGSERDELKIIYDQVGTPTNAADLALSIIKITDIISKGTDVFEPGIYHYSNEGVCSWYDFAKAIIELSGKKCHVLPIETYEYPLPAKRPQYSVLNKAKIKKAFIPEIPHWRDSLVRCLNILNA